MLLCIFFYCINNIINCEQQQSFSLPFFFLVLLYKSFLLIINSLVIIIIIIIIYNNNIIYSVEKGHNKFNRDGKRQGCARAHPRG